jgi:hypothetical protein
MVVTFPKNTGSIDKVYTIHYEEDGNPKAVAYVTVKGGNCGCIDETNVIFAADTLLITNITVTGLRALPKIYISLDYDEFSPDSATWVNIGRYTTFSQSEGKSSLKEELRWKEDLGLTVTTASTPAVKVVQVGCPPVIKQLNGLQRGPKLDLEIRTDYAQNHIDVWYVELSDTTQRKLDYERYFNYISVNVPYYETKNKFLKTYQARLELNNTADRKLKLMNGHELNNYYQATPDNVDIDFIDANSYLYIKNAKIYGTQANTSISAAEKMGKWIELNDGTKKKVLVHLQYNHPHDGEPIDDGLDDGRPVLDDNSQIH